MSDQVPFQVALSAFGTFRTPSKLYAFNSLNQFRPLILNVTHRAGNRVPCEMVC